MSRFKQVFMAKPTKKQLLFTGCICLAITAFSGVSAYLLWPEVPALSPLPEVQKIEKKPEPVVYTSPLTGMVVDQELSERKITAVMIENSIDARPQSGLEEAGVVFEAIAEGGITRFLALYQEAKPKNIGPVRSARPYYVRWAAGFDAAYVHSGGSGEALALIPNVGVEDLDHGKLGTKVGDRVSTRYAPHNVYTNMDKLDAAKQSLGYTAKSEFTPLKRKVAKPSDASDPATATNIQFNISGANYNTSYVYSAETNEYKRSLAGRPHSDQESGKQITPEVVVALIMSYSIHADGTHSVYANVGSGDALIFQDGKVTTAKWYKENDNASLSLKDQNGSDIGINPGQTWFTAMPSADRVSYTP